MLKIQFNKYRGKKRTTKHFAENPELTVDRERERDLEQYHQNVVNRPLKPPEKCDHVHDLCEKCGVKYR